MTAADEPGAARNGCAEVPHAKVATKAIAVRDVDNRNPASCVPKVFRRAASNGRDVPVDPAARCAGRG